MAGGFRAEAEVAGGADQARPEMMQPDPIDPHAGGQGLVGSAIALANSSRPLPRENGSPFGPARP
jgi:hypothetical protein